MLSMSSNQVEFMALVANLCRWGRRLGSPATRFPNCKGHLHETSGEAFTLTGLHREISKCGPLFLAGTFVCLSAMDTFIDVRQSQNGAD